MAGPRISRVWWLFGVARAEAMAHRDARGENITDADWSEIERQLRAAHQRLRAGIGN
jgi:hypothetical protein